MAADIDALEASLQHGKRLALRQDHQHSLQRLYQVLGLHILLHQCQPQLDETRRLNKLDQCAQLYKLLLIQLIRQVIEQVVG